MGRKSAGASGFWCYAIADVFVNTAAKWARAARIWLYAIAVPFTNVRKLRVDSFHHPHILTDMRIMQAIHRHLQVHVLQSKLKF